MAIESLIHHCLRAPRVATKPELSFRPHLFSAAALHPLLWRGLFASLHKRTLSIRSWSTTVAPFRTQLDCPRLLFPDAAGASSLSARKACRLLGRHTHTHTHKQHAISSVVKPPCSLASNASIHLLAEEPLPHLEEPSAGGPAREARGGERVDDGRHAIGGVLLLYRTHLDFLLCELHARRHAIDHASHPAAVRLAEGGDAEHGAERVGTRRARCTV